MRTRSSFALALIALALPAGQAAAQSKGECDRRCLTSLLDDYLAALVAHDPSGLKIAKNARFVENIMPMQVGEGLWKTASAEPTTFKIYVPDPVAQQVGFLGVMQEAGKPIEVAIRLKLDASGAITEMEHLIARNLRETSLANLETPRQAFVSHVPAARRNSRDEVLRIARTYYDALDDNDGGAAPFADDCVRRENGMQTTGNPPPEKPGGIGSAGALGCAAQLDTGAMAYIDTIGDRRVEIADVETGLAFGLSHFHHSMKQKYVTIKGIPGVAKIDMNFDPFDLPAAHVFKVSGGKLHEIEAMGFMAPYNSPSGW